MKIATSELEHLREEVKNCHQIIKDLQKKREFVGLTDEERLKVADQTGCMSADWLDVVKATETALQIKNK